MTLLEFLKQRSVDDRRDFAERCGTSLGHLMNVAYGVKPCGEGLAVEVDRESKGDVTCESLCPDVDWAYVRGSSKKPSRVTTRRCG